MSDSTFECPSCNARYKRGNLQAGQRVKCVKCEAVITIPEEIEELTEIEEIEEIEEVTEDLVEEQEEVVEGKAPRASSRAGARGSRASGGKRAASGEKREPASGGRATRAGASRSGSRASSRAGSRSSTSRGSRRGRPEESEAKSKMPWLLGIGGIVVVAAIVFFVMSGKGNGKTGQGEGAQNGGQKQAQKPKVKSPKEQLDEVLAKADQATDSKEKVAQYEAALKLLDDYNIDGAGITEKDLYERIVEADTNNAKARRKLGFYRFEKKGYAKSKGKWYTKEQLGEVTKDYEVWKQTQETLAASKKEQDRWTKDAWTKKVAKVRDYFEKDIKPVPDFKLKYFFDMPEVPRPYLLMIEDIDSPDPENSAKQYGPALETLRETFARAYQSKGILADWDETERVVPILMFGSRKSYYKYRDNGHTDLPKSDYIGAFYVHKAPEEMSSLYRGTLYVWQMPNDKEFFSTLFHEATHQLMHNACKDEKMGDTPWVEEGMAEFWSGYVGNIHGTMKFGRMHKGRWRNCQSIADAWYAKQRGQGRGPLMTPKQMVHYGPHEFNLDRSGANGNAGQIRNSLVYAIGWGLIHFCYNYKDKSGKAPYRDAMEKIIKDELRYDFTPKKAEEYLGIKNDEDWKSFNKKFFFYIKRTLRTMPGKEYIPGQKANKGD